MLSTESQNAPDSNKSTFPKIKYMWWYEYMYLYVNIYIYICVCVCLIYELTVGDNGII